MKCGFDSIKYHDQESDEIKRRLSEYGRLYLEVGGHLQYDSHASRVLPGFHPGGKLMILSKLNVDKACIVCTHAAKIIENGPTSNSQLHYQDAALSLISDLSKTFDVAALVVTRAKSGDSLHPELSSFLAVVKSKFPNIQTHVHHEIPDYPRDLQRAMNGFAENSVVQFRPSTSLVIVTGVQANSGKLGTCLSQLYHEKGGAIYSKIELFPIWNLAPDHPINVAYEAATADLGDSNCWDPFHLDGKQATNYNRDVEAFPVLKSLMESVLSSTVSKEKASHLMSQLYVSPTSMGVNRAGFCITDEPLCSKESRREIARRFLAFTADGLKDAARRVKEDLFPKVQIKSHLDVLPAAAHYHAIEFQDGTVVPVVVAKSALNLMTEASAVILGALGSGDDSSLKNAFDIINTSWIDRTFHLEDDLLHYAPQLLTCKQVAMLANLDITKLLRSHIHLRSRPSSEDLSFLLTHCGSFVTFSQ